MNSSEMSDFWPVRRFCALSAQFHEAYAAYAHRPSQQSIERRVADEVELFLICHALELALKGWLFFRTPDMTAHALRRTYGHDLFKLANAVLPYYPDIEQYLSLIKALGRNAEVDEPFNHREYGYPDIEDKGIPVPMPLEPFAEFVAQCRFDLSLTCERDRSQQI